MATSCYHEPSVSTILKLPFLPSGSFCGNLNLNKFQGNHSSSFTDSFAEQVKTFEVRNGLHKSCSDDRPQKHFSNFAKEFEVLGNNEEFYKQRQGYERKKCLSNSNSSTLSLHITAYENSIADQKCEEKILEDPPPLPRIQTSILSSHEFLSFKISHKILNLDGFSEKVLIGNFWTKSHIKLSQIYGRKFVDAQKSPFPPTYLSLKGMEKNTNFRAVLELFLRHSNFSADGFLTLLVFRGILSDKIILSDAKGRQMIEFFKNFDLISFPSDILVFLDQSFKNLRVITDLDKSIIAYADTLPKSCSSSTSGNNKSSKANDVAPNNTTTTASNTLTKSGSSALNGSKMKDGNGSSSSDDEKLSETFSTAIEKSATSSSGEDKEKAGGRKKKKTKARSKKFDTYKTRNQRKAAKNLESNKNDIGGQKDDAIVPADQPNLVDENSPTFVIDKNDKQLSAAVSYMKHSVNWNSKKFDQLRDLLKDTVYSTYADQMCTKFLEDLENNTSKIESSELLKILLHFIPKRMQPKIDNSTGTITASSELSTPLKTTELSLNDTQNSSTVNSTQASPTNKTQNSFDSTQIVRTEDDPPRNVLPTHSTPIIPANKHPRVHRRLRHRSPTNATLSALLYFFAPEFFLQKIIFKNLHNIQ